MNVNERAQKAMRIFGTGRSFAAAEMLGILSSINRANPFIKMGIFVNTYQPSSNSYEVDAVRYMWIKHAPNSYNEFFGYR